LRKGAAGNVTAEDDRVGILALDLPENRLQRRYVAVDVVERGDPQRVTP
jgi:hypothetical protein